MLLLITVFVPVLASRNVFWSITSLGFLVVHFTGLAAKVTGLNAIQANIEPLAISWVSVLGMRNGLASHISLLFLWAGESILQLLVGSGVASLATGIVGPHTGSGVFVKVESGSAGDFGGLSFDAVEEHVANGRIRMSEESVLAWAQVVTLGWLQLYSIAAVNVEGLIALVDLPDRRVEHETIGAEFLRCTSVVTLVELVTLYLILVLTVLRWTFELLGMCTNG